MYITYDIETKRVAYIGTKRPISRSKGLAIAEFGGEIPKKYSYLTFEEGKLVAHIIEQTAEQIEAQKQARYKARVDALVREKYSVSDEFALHRQRDTKPEEFAEYNTYVEECKAQAKAEADETKG